MTSDERGPGAASTPVELERIRVALAENGASRSIRPKQLCPTSQPPVDIIAALVEREKA